MRDFIELWSTVWRCIYEYQTLLAGMLALFSAVLAGKWVLRAARMPLEAETKRLSEEIERRRRFTCLRLSNEFMRVCEHARQAEGTIKVTIGARSNVTDDTREKTTIAEPPLLDDWESMSLLSDHVLSGVLNLRALLRRHNFDMARAGGSFGDDNFQKQVLRQAVKINSSAQQVASDLANEATRGVSYAIEPKTE